MSVPTTQPQTDLEYAEAQLAKARSERDEAKKKYSYLLEQPREKVALWKYRVENLKVKSR